MSQPSPRFLADRMLGKLARFLRMAGYDTLYVAAADDGPSVLDEARKTGRTLLTRNRRLGLRCLALGIPCVIVRDNYSFNQTSEVLETVPSGRRPIPFSRCLACNAILEDVAGKEQVRGWVPPFVFETQAAFRRCPACRRIFWNATHKRAMDRFITSILAPAGRQDQET